MKINKSLLPVKAHFFFFFAALGPLLPQMNVFGRQLGVTPAAMGIVTAILPLLWATAKPLFGYVVDYWPAHRKLVFMLLISVMTGSYCCLWFLPTPETVEPPLLEYVYKLETVDLRRNDQSLNLEKYTCHWNCTPGTFDVYLRNTTLIDTAYLDSDVTNSTCLTLNMDLSEVRDGQVKCTPRDGCDLLCYEKGLNRVKREISGSTKNLVDVNEKISGDSSVETGGGGSVYVSLTFWAFVVLMSLGTVAFNVANCIGDAVCFDVLGPDRGSKYGAQRAWGTIGYGVTALLGGCLVDMVSDGKYKDYTPAFVIALIATGIDLYSCRALTLPSLSSPTDSGAALRSVLRIPKVIVFIVFAVLAGTFDSFIIYYMFWFLEELAEETGSIATIKLIEGVVVAAQSFVGELLFFFCSGKIIKRWGYGTTLTFSLFCYGIRMALISFIRNPWQLVLIEGIMQGPTYALCYATIVGYAAHVAPDGYSATVQGIVAGMDDGVGFALGSLLGGQLYGSMGGRYSFRVFSVLAVIAAALHAAMFLEFDRADSCWTNDDGDKPKVTRFVGRRQSEVDEDCDDYNYDDVVTPDDLEEYQDSDTRDCDENIQIETVYCYEDDSTCYVDNNNDDDD
ncbi:major facilitator superfamily domain-containing protein 6 isoform X2 [Bombyx mori]|uniref:Major facilitator superfamily (MFS) profile domain-containing protein n=1 Tax=Bombyx mori TaxID=7091 RepID=A0A8R2M9A0_BOMMO|nr:major facilitator superfamily domain-containing protein 6 isoform X2 [Bombyx mori]